MLQEERGVEPLAMKIFAGIVLLVIGLGIGYGVYMWASGGVHETLSFSVDVSPNSATLSAGENINVTVTVRRIGTYDKTVTLDATGEPDDVTVSFSPTSGVPEFGSTMTIRVASGATPGATTLTIRARGTDDIEKVATFTLTLV